MELVVRKYDLLKELQLFQGIVERKNTIPILANVLFDAKGDTVRLAATDLEVGLRAECKASIAKAGALTLPAKKLFEIVKELPDTDIRIEEEKSGTVKVAADRFEGRMQTMSKDDFPTLPDLGAGEGVAINAKLLREMVVKTQFAITGEDTRYFLNGALLVVRYDVMMLVATDGHRLAIVTAPREGDPKVEETRTILPKKTLSELGRLLADGTEEIRFARSDSHIFFRIDGRLLVSRMIDGQFPAYERVIPKNNDKRIEFERDRFQAAIRRVSLLSNERSRAIKFAIEPGRVEIASQTPDLGEAREQIAVEYTGPAMTISFNAQYVLEFLGVSDTDLVAVEFKDDVSQTVMKPIGVTDFDYTYVVMPMRV
jgi:DNA polymerase-3 subunit beta